MQVLDWTAVDDGLMIKSAIRCCTTKEQTLANRKETYSTGNKSTSQNGASENVHKHLYLAVNFEEQGGHKDAHVIENKAG
jgi:hypothetical protein